MAALVASRMIVHLVIYCSSAQSGQTSLGTRLPLPDPLDRLLHLELEELILLHEGRACGLADDHPDPAVVDQDLDPGSDRPHLQPDVCRGAAECSHG